MWSLEELPDITFVSVDVEEMQANALVILEGIMGRSLARADPLRLFVNSLLNIIAQQKKLIDKTAKQNLLRYATDGNLDHIGALVGAQRLQATAAICTVKVTLSAAREQTTTIIKGTRVTSGDKVYFALDSDVIFLAGETTKEVTATCTETGEVGNDYIVGELKEIVDPQPYLLSIVNTTKTSGGSDTESDNSFRERIHEAPESFSTAGTELGYIYFVKSVSSLISDVKIISSSPGVVDIYVLLEGGQLPNEDMLNLVSDSLSAKDKRPLTDKVVVKIPETVYYDIELRYVISREDATMAALIQEAVETALQGYIEWQRGKLGRDINTTELYYRMRKAGVKRLEILSPTPTTLTDTQVAIPQNINVVYAGLEDE